MRLYSDRQTSSVYQQEDQQKVGSTQSVDWPLGTIDSYGVLNES